MTTTWLACLATAAPAAAVALDVVDADDIAEICRRTEPPSRSVPLPWLVEPRCPRAAERDSGAEETAGSTETSDDAASVAAVGDAEEACVDAARSLQAIAAHRFANERAELLLQSHRASIPAASFQMLPYDEETELLSIPVAEGFTLFGGAWQLEIEHDEPIEFAVSAAEAADLEQRWAVDGLTMLLTFELPWSTDPRGAYCHEDLQGASVLRVHPLRAELIDVHSGEALVSSRTRFDVAADLRSDGGSGEPPQPSVRVTSLEVVSGGANEDLDFEMMRLAIEFGLLECYLRGLTSNARLQGAMVFVLDAGALESNTPPTVSIDALGSSEVHACTVDVLSRLPWPSVCGRTPPAETQLRATVLFDR